MLRAPGILRAIGAAYGSRVPSIIGCGSIDQSELPTPTGWLAPLQVRWKPGKRKRNPKRADRTAEMNRVTGGAHTGLQHVHMEPETPYNMSLEIRRQLRGRTADGRYNERRKKDISLYTNYRVLRVAGMTHDNPQEEVDRRGFVTPLTELQDNAHLPRSALHRRFHFPHTLNYKVFWGPPSVMKEPGEYEGSMVGCTVAMRLKDLPLTQRQKELLVEILGPNRFDEETEVITLEADEFPDRNHNAALLGDMLAQLMREVASADDAPISPERADVKQTVWEDTFAKLE